jgi:hypothetical protein
VDATPAGSPHRAGRLSNLATALHLRFIVAGRQADLDAMVDARRAAVEATPADHPDHAKWLNNFSLALQARFERAGRRADLDAAVDAGRAAVEATPADHPDRAAWLYNLGTALQTRFERAGRQADLDAAVDAGRAAVGVGVASPWMRARAAGRWGHAAAAGGRWAQAVEGFTAAAELLGQVAPRSLARTDQEHLLADLGSGLGADAAACCVHAGRAGRAVELFEQSRGVLLGQALDTRTDLTALGEQHPQLADRFAALRDELDRADDHAGSVGATPAGFEAEDRAERAGRDDERRDAAGAFDRLLGEIRQLPGFRGFLRPPPVADLQAATAGGPVAVVAVSAFGSHALILTSGGVLEPVPLPVLTPEAVHERVVAFLAALGGVSSQTAGTGGRAAAEQQLADTLGWLWEAVAGPVLDRLGIDGPPPEGQPWPRLWWCASGLLSFLPVHAAGRHDTRHDAAPATVIDRVASSYTPTVRALAHARRSRPGADGDATDLGGGRAVAVAMPHTPGASDLPGVQAEATVLRRRLGNRVTVLTGPQATHEGVLAALPGARWAHFACHGAAEPANPSASRLLLADHEERPLTVVDVARLRLDDAELAFLSACSTAQPGARLADEAIHLASGFQLAGYRHVVGTLWPIGDQHAVNIADDVYAILADTGDVAGAVHGATRRLRDRWADRPSVWASHIHAGA